jgi:hypothetical protein
MSSAPDPVASPATIQIVFDCGDPHAQARFWAAALGYEVEQVDAFVRRMLDAGHATDDDVISVDGRLTWKDGVAASDPAGRRPRIYFQRVPEPKVAKNRVHLDLQFGAERRADEVARLEALGARPLYEGRQGPHSWITMADPEGNEFCVA